MDLWNAIVAGWWAAVCARWAEVCAWWTGVCEWWIDAGWPWISGWLQSPGFAGTAAVVAAIIAFRAARNQQRLDAWWKRVEWALGLYTPQDATDQDRRVGLAALEALQASKLAKRPEAEFVAGVVDAVTLDPLGDGAKDDDWEDSDDPANTDLDKA